jgi:hypothetical protein
MKRKTNKERKKRSFAHDVPLDVGTVVAVLAGVSPLVVNI